MTHNPTAHITLTLPATHIPNLEEADYLNIAHKAYTIHIGSGATPFDWSHTEISVKQINKSAKPSAFLYHITWMRQDYTPVGSREVSINKQGEVS